MLPTAIDTPYRLVGRRSHNLNLTKVSSPTIHLHRISLPNPVVTADGDLHKDLIFHPFYGRNNPINRRRRALDGRVLREVIGLQDPLCEREFLEQLAAAFLKATTLSLEELVLSRHKEYTGVFFTTFSRELRMRSILFEVPVAW